MKPPHLRLLSSVVGPGARVDSTETLKYRSTFDAAYRHMLEVEAFAMRAGDDITPSTHHVCAVIDLLMDMAARSDRLADLAQQLMAERASEVARQSKKRWNTPIKGQFAPKTTRLAMAVNFPAISQILNLFIDAFNDSANAFGKKQGITSISGFANLLPDVMGLVSNVGDLKAEFDAIKASDIAGLVSQVESGLSIPNAKADAVVKDVLGAIVAILGSVTSASQDVEAAMVKHTN